MVSHRSSQRRDRNRRAALPGALALTLLCGLGCGLGAKEESWVARVDETTIELRELREAAEARFRDEPDAAREEIALQELDRLVNETVTLNRANKLEIQVQDSEVDERLGELLGDAAQIDRAVDPAYREAVRRQMLLDRTALAELGERIRVSETALLHHFEANRERYAEPEQVVIRQIVVEEESKARQLLSDLRKGADFDALSRAHSLSPDAEQGGLLRPYAKGDLPEVFEQAFKLSPGRLSNVLESPYGFHIFRLEERLPASAGDFESARELIREELERTRLEELQQEWLLALRRQAEVEVNETALESLL